MDLLDSIMSKMDKPPSINDKQKKMMKGGDILCYILGYHLGRKGLMLLFNFFQNAPMSSEFVSLKIMFSSKLNIFVVVPRLEILQDS